jgi:uncharacterized repeat protein (TIGR03803 family)
MTHVESSPGSWLPSAGAGRCGPHVGNLSSTKVMTQQRRCGMNNRSADPAQQHSDRHNMTHSICRSRGIAAPAILVAAVLAAMPSLSHAWPTTETVLHSYTSAMSGCGGCSAPPMQASDGHLYGTTDGGSALPYYWGTIYRIRRSGRYELLHVFDPATEGGLTNGGLTQASDGNLYGVTRAGGEFDEGTLFRFSPGGKVAVVDSFGHGKGKDPWPPIQASDGRLYGITSVGGRFDEGTIYRVNTGGHIDSVFSFSCAQSAGTCYPRYSLIEASDGYLYGVTGRGVNKTGSVFRVDRSGNVEAIHSFGPKGSGDGVDPSAALMQGADGALYGVTREGGAADAGVVFRLTLSGQYSVLHSFSGADGAFPRGRLVQDDAGVIYGATESGGPKWPQGSYGTAFRLTADGTLTSLYSWTGEPDGAFPSGLTLASDGRFYGTTPFGGEFDFGSIFRLKLKGDLAPVQDRR